MNDGHTLIVTLGQARGIGAACAENLCVPPHLGEEIARRWYARTQGPNAKTWKSLTATLNRELTALRDAQAEGTMDPAGGPSAQAPPPATDPASRSDLGGG
ncbi:hypothetical protein ACILG0_08630 [Pseudomonadota bacterium AL_CKDN230030165-1A_HGKHYDSX7]